MQIKKLQDSSGQKVEFQDFFSTIQILREINLGNFKASVNSNFGFCRFAKKLQNSKQTLNEDLKLPKLVAPKMWIAEKVSNFYKEARNER